MNVNSRAPRWPWTLAAAAFIIYQANLRVIPTQDALPARLLPMALLQHGHLDYAGFFAPAEPVPPYAFRRMGSHVFSVYSPLTGLLATPVFAVGLPLLGQGPNTPLILEKVSASLFAAAVVAALGFTLSRLVSYPSAVLATLIAAFGTSLWTIASQSLWQHGPAALCAGLGLLGLCGAPSPRRAMLVGLSAGLAIWARPTGIMTALALGYGAFRWSPRHLTWFGAGTLPGLLCALGYNLWAFGLPFGGYQMPGGAMSSLNPAGLFNRLAGLLLSPNRGLWMYSPVLLVSLFAIRRLNSPTAHAAAAGAAGYLLLYASHARWDGGWAYGPRYLTDSLPFWIVFVALAAEQGRRLRMATLILGLLSAGVQAAGAFRYDVQWDIWNNLDAHPDRVWNWPRTQMASCLGLYPWDRDSQHLTDAIPFPGNVSSPTLLGTGWHIPEGRVAWTRPGRATLYVTPLPLPKEERKPLWLGLSLMTRTSRARQPEISVDINGRRADTVRLPHPDGLAWNDVIIPIRETVGPGTLEITLTCPTWFHDWEWDNLRRYALGVRAVAVGNTVGETARRLRAGPAIPLRATDASR